jgi:adenylyltransferase/sulfurtransferase
MSKFKGRLFDEFYSRQMVMKELGRKGQRRLAASRGAVVGLGGLGTASSLYLALAGVGYLRLIDQDVVELHNLHRQILYGMGNVDYPKVEASAVRLQNTNPLVEVEPVAENLNVDNVDRLLSGVDIVVDGLDNMRTRYLVNRFCAREKIPYVFGAAVGVEGNLSVFSPPETACLECIFPNVKDADLMGCDVRGVLGATAGIVGTMQAMETVKVLTGIGAALRNRLLICDFADAYFTVIDVFKDLRCPVCSGASLKLPRGIEKIVWLCGERTANVNPEKPMERGLDEVYREARRMFRVRVKSRLAMLFDYKGFEVTLFNGGRMLIRNVSSEEVALKVYREVYARLGLD